MYYNPNSYNPDNYEDSYEEIDARQGTVQSFEHINATGASFNQDKYSYHPIVYNESPIDIFTEDIAITHLERTIYTPRECFSIQQGLHLLQNDFYENDNRQNKTIEQVLGSFPVPEFRARKCHKETCIRDPFTGKKHCTTSSYYCGSDTRTTTHKFVFVLGYPTSVTQAAENRIRNCFLLAVEEARRIIASEGSAAIASGGTAIAALVAKALGVGWAKFKVCILAYADGSALLTLLSYKIEHKKSTSNWHKSI